MKTKTGFPRNPLPPVTAPGVSMQSPLRPSRNPLDLAFWALIVAICVVMGGGIYAMGVRGRPNRPVTNSSGQASNNSLAQSANDAPVEFDGSIETDPSSGPRRFSKPIAKGVSQPSGDLTGIEERLDAIASNLGELRQSVHRQSHTGSPSLEPTVEFVREFRHLLETGQRHLQPLSTESENRRASPQAPRHTNPVSDDSPVPDDLTPPQAFLGEEEPATVTAQNPSLRASSSSSEAVPEFTIQQDEPVPSAEDDSESLPPTKDFLRDDVEVPTTEVAPHTTEVEIDSDPVTEIQTESTDSEESNTTAEVPAVPTETFDSAPALTETESTGDASRESNDHHLQPHQQDLQDLEADDPSHVSRQLPPPAPGRSTSTQSFGSQPAKLDDLADELPSPEANSTQKDTPPTAVQLFYPKHRTVEQLVPQIQKYLTPGIGKVTATDNLVSPKARGVGPAPTKRQAIAVKDTHAALQQIAELLDQTDVPSPQVPEASPAVEFTVDVTAVGIRVSPQQRRGIDLQDLSSAGGPYTLWAHPTDRILKCAAGLPNDRDGRLKLAIFNGEEASLLRDLRDQGPLQAVARSRVTMKSTEASRLVVEQESGTGRSDRMRDHSIGVRPMIHSDGSLRLQVLPGTDAQGRPIEQTRETPEPIGEVELRDGETAMLAGIFQSPPQSGKNRSAASRGRLGNEVEVIEWIYLITPQKHSGVKTTSRSPQGRNSSPISKRIRDQRQTASR